MLKTEKLAMIHKQNLLIIKLLWSCFMIAVAVNALLGKSLYPFFPLPAAFLFCTIITLLTWKKVLIRQTPILILLLTFTYLTAFTSQHPTSISFSFIWAGLVLCSLYQDSYIIVFSGLMTIGYINYFYYQYNEYIFFNTSDNTNIWLSLIATFITILLFFISRFFQDLILQAELSKSGALKELKFTQEYLDTFMDNIADATCITNLHGDVTRVNKAFETMFGWTEKELIRNSTLNIPNEEIYNELLLKWREATTGKLITNWETLMKHKSGTILNIIISIFPVHNEHGQTSAIVSISRDITENKRTEEYLRNSDKLNAIGQLAAGVAHEIRNPLTTVFGFIQLLKRRNPSDNEHYALILSELERINFITNEFLVLSKPHVNNHFVKDLILIINDVVKLLKTRAIITNVEISTDYSQSEIAVNCDENQLKQVFINVIKNGIEAMQTGGILLICTETDNKMVKIKFIDQGCGIEPGKLEMIGKPFFTTKENGNGLGLVVSKKIIDNHEGIFKVFSQVDIGTCVEIALPVCQECSRRKL
ncbi:MAG: hypothetical protein H6Q67_281 [Firmicutes bacterium]|nr:hypothetical protein [Bacillota bacterium]